MPIFIEIKGTRYEVLSALPDNNYLVEEVDKQGRKMLTNTGKIIHYDIPIIKRIKDWILNAY